MVLSTGFSAVGRAFCYAKEKNLPIAKATLEGAGDLWTWTALDPDNKLMVAYAVGDRDQEKAREFMFDLAGRLANRVQLTTDGFSAYLKAVRDAFAADVDSARLIKLFGEPRAPRATSASIAPACAPASSRSRCSASPTPTRSAPATSSARTST